MFYRFIYYETTSVVIVVVHATCIRFPISSLAEVPLSSIHFITSHLCPSSPSKRSVPLRSSSPPPLKWEFTIRNPFPRIHLKLSVLWTSVRYPFLIIHGILVLESEQIITNPQKVNDRVPLLLRRSFVRSSLTRTGILYVPPVTSRGLSSHCSAIQYRVNGPDFTPHRLISIEVVYFRGGTPTEYTAN